MTRLILIRHGETDWNVEGRYQGQSDVPLSERGRFQAAEMRPHVQVLKPAAIYSSDLIRARETAEILASPLQLTVRIDPRLREIHLGEWEGLLFDEIQARYSGLLKLRREDPAKVSAPGGETVAQVRDRVLAATGEIAERHRDQTVVLVAHGLPLAILIALHQHRPLTDVWDLIPENLSLHEVRMNQD